jgi:hypothetical protein
VVRRKDDRYGIAVWHPPPESGLEEKATDHIGMEEIGDDAIGSEEPGFRKKPTITNKIKKPAQIDGGYWDPFFCEAWREFAGFPKGEDAVLKAVGKKRKYSKEHMFASSAIERLDDMNDFFLSDHVRSDYFW